MKSTITTFFTWFFVLLTCPLWSQSLSLAENDEECAFTLKHEKLMEAHPELRQMLEDYKTRILPQIAKEKRDNPSFVAPILRVPLVVHVIHNPGENPGEGQNLSDARIQAQIDVLNEDFSATNPNFGDTPARWQSDVGNPEIQFCLASIDPDGNPTTGIVRHDAYTVTVDMDGNDNIESEIKPAINWDADNYYNIYTLPIPGTTAGGGTTGYAYLPSPFTIGNGNTDGTVVDYRWFGGPGFGQSGYKTLTHETGHYLGLYHPFGGNSFNIGDMVCSEDDGLDDTPNVDRPTSCFPGVSCGNEHMYINYMDYSRGSCKTSFTNDQIAIMRAVLNGEMNQYNWGSRLPLANNTLAVCTFNTNDAAVAEIQQPGTFQCDTMMIAPEVKITNFGIDPLTTVTINYQINNGTPVSFVWIDNLPSGGSSVVTLPTFSPPAGMFEFKCYTTLPNGQPDENTSNDTLSTESTTVVTQSLPLQEDFNDTQFDPTINGVFSLNIDQDTFAWARNDVFSAFGENGGCAQFDNYTTISGANPGGKLDGLITPIYDFSNVEDATLRFDLAYAPYDASFFDSLIVIVSTDCGATYNQELYRDGNIGMATAPYHTFYFVPQDSEWRTEEINLSAFNNMDNVSFAFFNRSGYGNVMYLDNIQVVPACFLTVEETVTNLSCNSLCEGAASLEVSGGAGNYTYQWDANTGSQVTATATNLCAGDYDVTISDADGCTRAYSVSVSEPDELTVGISGTPPTGATTNDGTATATPAGGNDACYDYEWSNSGLTGTINNLPPGTYTVTITDCNDCTATESITLDAFDCSALMVDFMVTPVNCNGENTGAISLTPSGASDYTYAWDVPGVIGANPTDLGAGNYTYTVTDNNGCTATGSLDVEEPQVLEVGVMTTDLSGVGSNDGTATATGSGGTPGYTYDWGAFGSGPTISNLMAGVYVVTITDANGCTQINEGQVNGFDCSAFEVSDIQFNDVSCAGGNDGSATVFTTGGTPNVSYLWNDSNMQETQTAVDLFIGLYTVTATDGAGCTATAMVTIGEPNELNLTFATATQITCNGQADGALLVEVSGGTADYDFAWDHTTANTNSLSDLPAGTYCVTVTDREDCTDEDCITLTEPDPLVLSHFGDTDPLDCFGDLSGVIDFMASGGNVMTGYTYEWTPDVWGGVTLSLEDLPAGIYTGTVTDGLGCTATTSFEITEPSELELNATATPETTAGANDGIATATASGGTPDYTYDWGAAGTGPDLSNLAPGVYTVTVTDDNGCEQEQSVIVGSGNVDCSTFSATITSTPALCNGNEDGTATVNASGGTDPYEYDWSNGDMTATATGLGAGLVTVTITDANDCIVIQEINVEEPDPITIEFTITNATPPGGNGAITAMASGGTPGYTYEWTNLGGGPPMSGATIDNLAVGSYNVTVTDANGCTQTPSIPVEVLLDINDCSTLTATVEVTPVTCANFDDGMAMASGDGGEAPYTYDWGALGTGNTISNLTAGVYLVTVTDANDCTFIGEANVLEPDTLQIMTFVTNESSVGANDGAIAVGVIGGTPDYTYDWADLVGNDDPSDRNNLSPGTYFLTVTDANGCEATVVETVETGTLDCSSMGGSITSTTSVSCFGLEDGMATAAGSGGTPPYTYLWSNSDTGPQADTLATGTIQVTITDSRGCEFVAEEFIEQPDELSVTTSFMNETTAGANDGSASAVASGGTAPYNYDWGAAGTGSMIDNLAPGVYLVLVTDANGCTAEASVTISTGQVDCTGLTSFISAVPLTCSDSGDGIAAVVVTGGLAPYEYLWSNGDTGISATELSGGLVTVTITDSQGCILVDETDVPAPDPITVDMVITNESIAGLNDGAITATASGGTPPFTYDWGALGMGPSIDNLAPGTYVVEVIDSRGCQTLATAVVEAGMICTITTTFEVTQISCNGNEDGSALASAAGGVGNYTYEWSNGDTGSMADNLAPGVVMVTITDADNCILISETLIVEPDTLLVDVSTNDETTLGLNDGSATAMASGGTPPYSYDWGAAGTGETIDNLSPGTYQVLVTDANGCEVEMQVIINPGPPDCTGLEVSFDLESVSCFGANDGIATAVVEGGVPPYQYDWSNGSNSATINDGAGTYTVLITDAVGCEIEEDVTISQPNVLVINVVGLNGECGSLASVITNVTGGTEPYTYNWNTGSTDAILTDQTAGTYSVTVTDANGCVENGFANVEVIDSGISTEIQSQNVSCFGESDGAINVAILDGTPPYEIQWEDGSTGTSLDGLAAGTYTVQISDAAGCISLQTIVIESPAQLVASVNTQSSNSGESGGSATASILGGVAPYSYLWSTGANGPLLENLTAGTYSLTVTDFNGCTAETEFSIYTTGVEDILTLEEWNLSPNPSTGLFFLHAIFSEGEELDITVINILGQEVFRQQERGRQLDLSIDLSNQAAGTYFLRLKTSEGQLIEPMVLTR